MSEQFTWIPIYEELAGVLVKWQGRQQELIGFLEGLRAQQYVITTLLDRGADGSRFLLKEIDPFTFFGVFNRRIRSEQRSAILGEIKQFFGLQAELPGDFEGLPLLNNLNSWFFAYQKERQPGDIARLWRVFELALGAEPLKQAEFRQAFEAALTVRQTHLNLTMGLFWIRPEIFLNLDQTTRAYLGLKLPGRGLNFQYYLEVLGEAAQRGQSFAELSSAAWLEARSASVPALRPEEGEINYWLVSAGGDEHEPAEQTERFLAEGIWENGYPERYGEQVKAMQVGDRIAIQAYATRRTELPFDGCGKTVACSTIEAIGTIMANRRGGRAVEVEWEPEFEPKEWYFYTEQRAVWRIDPEGDKLHRAAAEQLINFAWYGQPQDYEWFCKVWQAEAGVSAPYAAADILAAGVFLDEAEIEGMLRRLSEKKAIILQGPPGVGKTFLARKLAYALLKEIDPERLEFIQFHQSYSYDDFVRGYRPVAGQPGSFGIQDGVFYEFCRKASADPERAYVFIIDEINRGNLSQIFGELLTLIENDKRGKEFAVPLVYHSADEPRFYIPSNLYLIGLMNLADRSLAMLDYALRRRFAFISLEPQFESERFKRWLLERGMRPELVELISTRMTALNREIREDPLLGENYQIGHSYFCPKGEHFSGLDQEWYRSVVRTEIVPLIKEYWFDNDSRLRTMISLIL